MRLSVRAPARPECFIVTGFDLDEHIDEVPGYRGSGEFVMKSAPPAQLVAAVLAVAAGEAFSRRPWPGVRVHASTRPGRPTTVTSRAFYDGLDHLVKTRTPVPGGQDVVRYSLYDPSQRLAFASVSYFVSAYTGSPSAAATPSSSRRRCPREGRNRTRDHR